MSTSVDNLVLEMLRAIRGELGEVRAELREIRHRLGALELGAARIERDIGELRVEFLGFRAETNERFDRVHDRLGRIERRMDLSPGTGDRA